MASTKSSEPKPGPQTPAEVAARMVRYMEVHHISGDVLRANPIEFEAQTKARENTVVDQNTSFVSASVEEKEALLEKYEDILKETPVSVEDHFAHFQTAFSATALLNLLVIHPRSSQDPSFFKEYNLALMEGIRQSKLLPQAMIPPKPDEPPVIHLTPEQANRPLLSRQEAENILSENSRQLMARRFYSRGSEDDEREKWWIKQYKIEEDDSEEYEVQFESLKSTVPHSRSDLVALLMESICLQ